MSNLTYTRLLYPQWRIVALACFAIIALSSAFFSFIDEFNELYGTLTTSLSDFQDSLDDVNYNIKDMDGDVEDIEKLVKAIKPIVEATRESTGLTSEIMEDLKPEIKNIATYQKLDYESNDESRQYLVRIDDSTFKALKYLEEIATNTHGVITRSNLVKNLNEIVQRVHYDSIINAATITLDACASFGGEGTIECEGAEMIDGYLARVRFVA